MNSKTRFTARGPFSTLDLGAGTWVLSQTAASARVYLRLTESEAAKLARISELRNLEVDWQSNAVSVIWAGSSGTLRLAASSAVVHEPKERLYDSLPLADFDRSAQRFWNRVFRVMRLPGGRFLLRFLARGGR
jgi:hypothetical protein